MGWLSGWNYRKSHEINGSDAGAVTNYQIRVKVHYGSGTDSGEDVYLNEHCRTDFGDVRFTSSDGETPLDYWIEEKVDGDYAIFWVEVDSIPASPDTKTIYIYYGKSDATSISNGEATFPFFDDFLGTSLDTDKWEGDTADYRVENLVAKTDVDYQDGGTIFSRTFSFSDGVVEAKVKIEEGTRANVGGRSNNDRLNRNKYDINFRYPNSDLRLRKFVDNVVYDLDTVTYEHSTTWKRARLFLYGSNLKADFDGSGTLSATDSTFSSGKVTIGTDTLDTSLPHYFYCDWIFVRNYVEPEPSHGAWGSEETYVAPIPIPIPVIVLPEPTYAKYFIPPQGLKYRRSVNKPPQG